MQGELPQLWSDHNRELDEAFSRLVEEDKGVDEDELALALFVKLGSMLTRMLHAPTLLAHFVARQGESGAPLKEYVAQLGDAAQMSLPNTFGAMLEAHKADGTTNAKLAAAARAVVDAVVDWATDGPLHQYAKRARLVAFVRASGNPLAELTAGEGLWLVSRGTGLTHDDGGIVGRMPSAAAVGGRFRVHAASPSLPCPKRRPRGPSSSTRRSSSG